jgi:hypothetical protein
VRLGVSYITVRRCRYVHYRLAPFH